MNADVLVIGCGIAGSVAALRLADAGFRVLVLTRAREPHESNTYYAQGGIVYRGPGDTPDRLFADIVEAGAGLNDPRAVSLLAELGPQLVTSVLVERVGVLFDREEGAFSLAREGGHSLPRIVHVGDATGRAIEVALIRQLQDHPNVTLRAGCTALELITTPVSGRSGRRTRCAGITVFDQASGQVEVHLAPRTILATGGFGAIFQRTTNPPGARGDGVAMAARAGARLANLEYVQFHPTAFSHPEAPAFLISEAVRGAGARLVHADGTPFMHRHAPKWGDLAPRDVVARAIFQEMAVRDAPHVYLDVRSALSPEEIKARFPNLYAQCRRYDVDMTRDLVPVAPAAHYTCGGVWCDEWGQTTVENLYAVGEVACTGLHGANRLASTSLLEGLVWGVRAAEHIQRTWAETIPPSADEPLRVAPAGTQPVAPAFLVSRAEAVRTLMWQEVGLVRTGEGLTRAVEALRQLQDEVEAVYCRSALSDELVGLRNMVQVARLVAEAALANPHSRGCHYRVEQAHAVC